MIPIASTEALGNVCNVHWWALYATFWLAIHRAKSTAVAMLLALAALALSLTEIQVAFFVPLLVYVTATRRTLTTLLVGSGVAAGSFAQIIAYFATGRVVPTTGQPTFLGAVRGYLTNVVMGSLTDSVPVLQQAARSLGYTSFGIVTAVFAIPIVLALVYSRSRQRRIEICYATAMSVLLWFFAHYENHSNYNYTDADSLRLLRWGVGAALCLLIAFTLAVDTIVQAKILHSSLAAAGLGLILATQCLSFTITNTARSTAPNWWAQVTAVHSECLNSDIHVTLPIAPNRWVINVPCTRLIGPQ